MAIDPATAKALAQAAVKIVTDREARSKLLYILLIAVSGGVDVLLIPVYILTHPMEMLKAAFADTPDDAAFVEQFKGENDDKVLLFGEGLIYEAVYPLPLKEIEITKEYGQYTDPATGEASFHYGTDFAGTWGSEVFSIADGEVVYVNTGRSDGCMDYLIIRHTGQRTNEGGEAEPEIFYALYACLDEIYLFEGQSVQQGAVIGILGGEPESNSNSNISNPAHLHFEIRKTQEGIGIDPAGYILPEQELEQEPEGAKPSENTESEASADEQQEKAD